MKILLIRASFSLLFLILITATLLPLFRKEEWWIRIFDFPRIQIAVLSLILLLTYFLIVPTRKAVDTFLMLLLSLCILYQAYMMFPYSALARVQVKKSSSITPGAHFSMLISNVLMTNRNSEQYLGIIRELNPDLVLAAETDGWWDGQLKVLKDEYPYSVRYPLANTYGMVLYSKLKLIRPEVLFLVEPDVPSIHTLAELPTGDLMELYCLHPKPPHPRKTPDTTERDAELLLVAKRVREAALPVVVAGDLNDVAWSHTTALFQKISGLLDPRIGRGLYNTFDAKNPLLRFPLDHIFHSSHFRLVALERGPYFGSDHFPIFIALRYEPEKRAGQKAPPPDRKSKQEAEEKIEKAQ
ncbi:MAG: endonuclease/exonuclease/phosphatase family protein [Alphaproteobacteria bacterium]|uniref:Endonuclease/exonuclease/phosphatase family protein n=1 Tax=Candidatus Nitrobium versatile TaxID=2884831 RepID=A0A953LXJ0_9BACT|nr:endonuclease/exonuclease/phosphatase family protein [Candidatus Nitrobium versatile]